MRVALVHDYLNEFGGAERGLLALSEIWPKAPIYTAFYRKGSSAYERFKNKDIRTSWAQKVPLFSRYLHSPLRFLAPLIWDSFDFSNFDVVIGSSSWYVTKGFKKRNPSTPLRLPFDSLRSHRIAQDRSGSLRVAQGLNELLRFAIVIRPHDIFMDIKLQSIGNGIGLLKFMRFWLIIFCGFMTLKQRRELTGLLPIQKKFRHELKNFIDEIVW